MPCLFFWDRTIIVQFLRAFSCNPRINTKFFWLQAAFNWVNSGNCETDYTLRSRLTLDHIQCILPSQGNGRIFDSASCKEIQDCFGFWIQRCGFRIIGTGLQYLSVELEFWIPWDVIRLPKPRNPDSLVWGDSTSCKFVRLDDLFTKPP